MAYLVKPSQEPSEKIQREKERRYAHDKRQLYLARQRVRDLAQSVGTYNLAEAQNLYVRADQMGVYNWRVILHAIEERYSIELS